MQTQKENPQIKRFHSGARISEMAVYNGIAYLAGQVTSDERLDIVGQTSNVLTQIDALLAEAGTNKSRILMCQIYLANLTDFAGINQVWDSWVTPGNTPPRATVQAGLASPAWLIEIVVTAALL
ncbi:MAG: hypothetical protein K0R08_17 [Solimicrobium sp.]|jgi:enamine deaminase RidA (YjgF/YER057c/UK114 family)|nr:hypothetical protein [Solimicrobium sp.]